MDYPFSALTSKMKSSKIRELMKYASMPGVISFGGGMPDPEEFPFDDVKNIINSWDKAKFASAMQYGPTPGYQPLIDKLKIRMQNKKIKIDNQDLIVTTGGQQALFLMCRAFLDPGDVVLIEEPTFIGAMAAFLSHGAKLVSIPLQNDGIDTDKLEKTIIDLRKKGEKIKFFYTIPNFQNPSGVTMSQDKRKKIHDISKRHEIVVLEDDPYCDLYFTEDNSGYFSIKSSGNDAPVVYLGSFSKILCPGFRLGWVIGDSGVIDKLALAKQSVDASSSSFGQVVANDYLGQNLIDNYLGKMRKIYKHKKEFMISKIREYLPAEVKNTDPDGGFFIYLNLPAGLKADDWFMKCFEKKVAFVTGEPFHVDPQEGNKHVRISFSNSTEKEMDYGLKVMGESIKELMSQAN